MLTYAHDLPDFGDQLAPLVAGEALFDFIVRIFIGQVDDIARRGIHRGYVDVEETGPRLRGRLLLALLARARFRDPELGPRVRRTLTAFAEASPAAMAPADCDRVVYSRLTERYRSPINLARLFLRYLSLEGRAGATPFVTFLVPMYQLFERFVARLLAEATAARPRYHVMTQHPIWLDEGRQLRGQPDIVLRRDGRAVLVLDTKYKVYGARPSPADVNQMVTYCQTLGVGRGVLIYPGDALPADVYELKAGGRLEVRALSLAGGLGEFKGRCGGVVAGFLAE